MPISMGGSRNVDSEGGTANGGMRPEPLACLGGVERVQLRPDLRVWLESTRVQRRWSVRRTWATRLVIVDSAGEVVFATALEPAFALAELSNDADRDGPDGA